jgi:hypothetical protein
MSDVDPTPTTPVTIGDRMQLWRVDVDARLTSIEAKLQALITLLSTGGNIDSAPIVAAVNGIGDGITLNDIHGLMDNINNALGGYPNNSLELGTVRGYLSIIALNAGKYGILPDGTAGNASSGSLTVNGRRYIVWSDLANISESEDGTYLTPSNGWDGYSIYIQTDAPSAILHDNTAPAQNIDPYDVNSWTDIGGDHTLAWSVAASYQVRGYIRTPAQDYITVSSVGGPTSSQVILLPNFSYDQYGANIGDGYGHSFRFTASTPTRTTGGPGGVGDPRIAWNDTFRFAYPSFDINRWYHIAVHTDNFQFYSNLAAFDLDWASEILPGSTPLS